MQPVRPTYWMPGPAGLGDPAWKRNPGRPLVDVRTGAAPGWQTDARLVYTDSALYVRFACCASTVRASMTRYKDKVWQEDAVEVYVRPPGDEYLYEFQVNPIGTTRDLRILQAGDPDRRAIDDQWCCTGLVTTAHVERRNGAIVGWQAMFLIPWASLGRSPLATSSTVDAWRVGLFRIERDPFEQSALAPTTRNPVDLHDPELMLPMTPVA